MNSGNIGIRLNVGSSNTFRNFFANFEVCKFTFFMILNYFNILRDKKSEVFLQMKVYAKKDNCIDEILCI